MKLVLALLLSAVSLSATTVVRLDPFWGTPQNPFPPAPRLLTTAPNSAVALCNDQSVPCTNLVTTYTDATGNTACPTAKQVVPHGTSTCSNVAGPDGNFGFWVAAGTYYYTYWPPGTPAPIGPFPITAGGSGGGGGTGPTILATDPSIGVVCDATTINSNTIVGNINAWHIANDNGTMYWPKDGVCLFVGQTSTSSIVVNTVLLGVSRANWVGDNTAIIVTTEAGSENINFEAGQSSYNCFSGSLATPTINYDYTSAAFTSNVAAGSLTVPTNPTTSAGMVAGDRFIINAMDQQGYGFPPNYRYFFRGTIAAINHSTGVITLSSAMPFATTTGMYSNSSTQNTYPPGIRDLSQTCAGGGTVQRPKRIYVQGFDFSRTIVSQSGQIPVTYAGGADVNIFEQCKFGYFSPGEGSTIIVRDSQFQWIEIDKAIEGFYVYNSTLDGNPLVPSGPSVASGSGAQYVEFNSTIFKSQPQLAARKVVFNNPTIYSNPASPYGWFGNGSFGYQTSYEVNSPLLYENGVSQGGIMGAGNGQQVTVASVPTGSTFTVTGGDILVAVSFAGPGTRVYDHIGGALIGTLTADPTGSATPVTLTGTFIGGACSTGTPIAGTGFVTGDLIQVNQGTAAGCQFTVTASSGVPSALTKHSGGAGYTTGTNLGVTRLSGSGVGLTVNITAVVANPQVGQTVDLNSNAQNVKVTNPIAKDFDINSVPPAFDSGITALFNNFSMQYLGNTKVADLGPCNAASTPATKWVSDAVSQSVLGSGGGTVPTSVYCIGTDQFSGTWVPTSAVSTPFLNGIATAIGNATLNGGIYSVTITGNPPANTTGNGTPNPPFLGFLGAKGQTTTGTSGQQAGVGQSGGCLGGPGGDAPSGSFNGFGGGCDIEGGAAGAGAGTAGGAGAVHMQRTTVAQTDIGQAGGPVCLGTVTDGTCSNGLYNVYVKGNEQHVGQYTNTGGIFNTSLIDSRLYGTLTSAATTATPNALIEKVTGTATISTIPSPSGCGSSTQSCIINLLADTATGPFTLTSGFNILLPGGASTFVAQIGATYQLNYDSTAAKWSCAGCGSGSGLPSSSAQQAFNTDSTNTPVSTAVCPGTAGCAIDSTGHFDLVTSVIPRYSAANPWTGANDFSAATLIKIKVGTTGPPCTVTGDEGSMWLDTTTATANHLKVCAEVSSTIGFQTIF